MTKRKTLYIQITSLAFAAALIIAGCGGGGGGAATSQAPAAKGSVRISLSLPRSAFQYASATYYATISILKVDSTGATTLVDSSEEPLYYISDTTGSGYVGYFALTDIPAANGYLVTADLSYSYGTARSAATGYSFGHFGAIVDVVEGVWNPTIVSPETTIAALAAMRYALTSSPAKALADVPAASYWTMVSYLAGTDSATLSFVSSFKSSYLMNSLISNPFSVSSWSSAMTSDLDGVITDSKIGADTTAPTVTSFSPAAGATNVAADGAAFKAIFSEPMDTTVDLNNSTTLTASGFSIALQRSDTGGSITINSTNALSYGTFSWTTTTTTNDTLVFTLKSTATLKAAGLKTLAPGKTYNITSRTVPTNIKDANGVAVSSTGIASTGSFTVTADTTAPTVSSFSPASGATGVAYNATPFKVIFSESMDSTVNLNNQTTLTASGFSITLQRADTGGSVTINYTNALNYGSFSWATTTYANDSLVFTLNANSTLAANNLKMLYPNKLYYITAYNTPTNLKDANGNALSATGLATSGSFTTSADTTAPTVSSFDPASGATGVAYDGPSFKVVFSEGMNNAVDLNNPTTLSASGFSITLQRQDTGGSLTINSTNALSYGSFAWTATTFQNDTLVYTLNPSSMLFGYGLKTLYPGATYNITGRTVPTNLTDSAGNALSAVGIASTGSFTTIAGPM